MEKNRETISFTSLLEGSYWYTFIHLNEKTIRITQDRELMFEGSIEDFKKLEEVKGNHVDRPYKDILRMSTDLIKLLTK